jgi:DNA-binding NarL/FixJ family response regulator
MAWRTARLEIDVEKYRSQSILLIDERSLALVCVHSGLWAALDFSIAAVAGIEDARMAIDGGQRPALVILSAGMRRVADDGIGDGIRSLIEIMPTVPVVILSDLDGSLEVDEAREAFRLGARGYIRSAMPLNVLVAAVRLVLAGGTFVPESMLARGALADMQDREFHAWDRLPHLTRREKDVLILLREGRPNKSIARELSLSVGTVQVHVRRILQKLHASNRSEVAYLISRLHFILVPQLIF